MCAVRNGSEVELGLNGAVLLNGVCVGAVKYHGGRGERVFVCHREGKHFFVKYNGFGFSSRVLGLLRSRGVRCVLLVYHGKSGDRVFVSGVDNILERGVRVHEEGFEPQLVLSVDCFEEVLGA